MAHLKGKNTSTFGHGPMGTSCGAKGVKIESETERFKHKTVGLSVAKKIMQARNAAGLTQKELAQKLSVKPAIIQTYEQGKGIPVGRVIQQIEKACGLEFGAISGKTRGKKKKQLAPGVAAGKKKKKKSKLKLIKT
jgi:ribosome-binding protein aMBF1 (putative translation factor)